MSCKVRQVLKNTQDCEGETRGRDPEVTTRKRAGPTERTAKLHGSPGPKRGKEAELMPKKYFISTPQTTVTPDGEPHCYLIGYPTGAR